MRNKFKKFYNKDKGYPIKVEVNIKGEPLVSNKGFIKIIGDKFYDVVNEDFFYRTYR